MNKEKNSIYEAISLWEGTLKTTVKEESSPQTAGESPLQASERALSCGVEGALLGLTSPP